MPRYEADPTKVAAGLEIFPKDDYELTIGEPKAFQRTGDKGVNYGVRFTLAIASEGQYKGKKYIQTCYEHSENAKPMNKRFIMAALGYQSDKNSEKRFDKDFEGADWSFDTDSGACGDAWRAATGKRIVGSFDVKLGDNGQEQQQVQWRPL